MPMLRFDHSDTIEDFLRKPTNEVIGNLILKQNRASLLSHRDRTKVSGKHDRSAWPK